MATKWAAVLFFLNYHALILFHFFIFASDEEHSLSQVDIIKWNKINHPSKLVVTSILPITPCSHHLISAPCVLQRPRPTVVPCLSHVDPSDFIKETVFAIDFRRAGYYMPPSYVSYSIGSPLPEWWPASSSIRNLPT